jgi:Fe-S-cluster containining protein
MRRKLPLLVERSLSQVRAEREGLASNVDAKLPLVSCKSGCSACCSYPVYISLLEGMLLYRHLTEKGHWTPKLRKALEAHATRTTALSADVWLMINLPCPLLEQNKCIAYSARPFTCRTLYARTPASYCQPNQMASSASFVGRDAVTTQFRDAEAKILARHKLALVGMPISRAILFGEKIVTGEVDVENLASLVREMWSTDA